jgi:hypothetical protein
MFEMRAQCGLPAFKPNSSDGIDIQYVQFDDDFAEPVDGEVPPSPDSTQPPPPPGSQPPPPSGGSGFRRPPRNYTISGSPPQNNQTAPHSPTNDNQMGYNQQQRPPRAGRYDRN